MGCLHRVERTRLFEESTSKKHQSTSYLPSPPSWFVLKRFQKQDYLLGETSWRHNKLVNVTDSILFKARG